MFEELELAVVRQHGDECLALVRVAQVPSVESIASLDTGRNVEAGRVDGLPPERQLRV